MNIVKALCTSRVQRAFVLGGNDPFIGEINRASNDEVSLYILPDGSGLALPQAVIFGGQQQDGALDLMDVILFTEDYYTSYHYRSDFHWDGALNLSDIGKIAAGMGHNCQ